MNNIFTRINYMRSARYWIVFSIVLTVVSLIALFTVKLNLGIDFKGGVLMDVQFNKQLGTSDVAQVVSRSIGSTPLVKQAEKKGTTDANVTEFLVTMPELTPEAKGKLETNLAELGEFKVISEESVSASVSSELTQRAALAVAIAAVLQILYITWRFQFRFGVTAVVALLHDLVITMGLMALLRVEVNSAFVAAILTVLGYSMNDTIIVFDRLRDKLSSRKKGEPLDALTTRAIREVIVRSLFTVLTTQMPLVALLIWGGESIRDFATTLLIGITSGAYSSIFIAAALWLFWQQRDDSQKKPAGKSKPARA